MLTRPEAADPAVEELRRRARRRLVGAVALALAAAVLLPLLLESDPKPLGGDVSIQIPPIDSGKFITPLSPAKGTEGKSAPVHAGAGALTPPKPAAPAADAPPEGKTASTAAGSGKPVEPIQAVAADATPASNPAGASVTAANTEPQKTIATPSKMEAGDTRPDVVAPAGAFVVQLAAFADAKAAPALVAKLKGAGFPGYAETLKTNQGTLRRVRVGPYATRDVAERELDRLKTAGYSGVVTAK